MLDINADPLCETKRLNYIALNQGLSLLSLGLLHLLSSGLLRQQVFTHQMLVLVDVYVGLIHMFI